MLFSQNFLSAKERPIVPPPPLPNYKYTVTLYENIMNVENLFYNSGFRPARPNHIDMGASGITINKTVYKHWGISVGYQAAVSCTYILNNRLKDSKRIIAYPCPNCETGTYIKRFI
ncbi:MAG: hypothetical protein EBX41_09195, partial [Chitinophagia bacterium]|nr:hypothetical protein [Chitinophagia bacterium]